MTTVGTRARTGRFAHFEALIRSVDHHAVQALRNSASATELRAMAVATTEAVFATFMNALIVFGFMAPIAFLPLLVAYDSGWSPVWAAAICILLSLSIVATFVFTLGRWRLRRVRYEWMLRGGWTHRWRMRAMARDNSLLYSPAAPAAPIGSVLRAGGGVLWDTFRQHGSDRVISFGNSRPRGRQGESHAPYGWFFVAVGLDADVPHMMLVPRNTRARVGAPLLTFGREQQLKLEGDFDRHFTLYAPADYGTDALYVITPDLMVLLIDHLPGSYVETFDSTLVITSPAPAGFGRIDTWDRIGHLIDTVIPKTVRQTRNYRDTRSDQVGQVAVAGRRLRVAFPLVAALITVAFITAQVVRVVLLVMR